MLLRASCYIHGAFFEKGMHLMPEQIAWLCSAMPLFTMQRVEVLETDVEDTLRWAPRHWNK